MGDLNFLSNIPLGNEELEVEFAPRPSPFRRKSKSSKASIDEDSSPEKSAKRKKNRGRTLEVIEESSSSSTDTSSELSSMDREDDVFTPMSTSLTRSAVIPRPAIVVERKRIALSDPAEGEEKKDKKKRKPKFVLVNAFKSLISIPLSGWTGGISV
jgi:hypothetical protein